MICNLITDRLSYICIPINLVSILELIVFFGFTHKISDICSYSS